MTVICYHQPDIIHIYFPYFPYVYCLREKQSIRSTGYQLSKFSRLGRQTSIQYTGIWIRFIIITQPFSLLDWCRNLPHKIFTKSFNRCQESNNILWSYKIGKTLVYKEIDTVRGNKESTSVNLHYFFLSCLYLFDWVRHFVRDQLHLFGCITLGHRCLYGISGR